MWLKRFETRHVTYSKNGLVRGFSASLVLCVSKCVHKKQMSTESNESNWAPDCTSLWKSSDNWYLIFKWRGAWDGDVWGSQVQGNLWPNHILRQAARPIWTELQVSVASKKWFHRFSLTLPVCYYINQLKQPHVPSPSKSLKRMPSANVLPWGCSPVELKKTYRNQSVSRRITCINYNRLVKL